jgi:regulator of replication initiation timing
MVMGFEHQVFLDLTSAQRSELHERLITHPFFSKAENSNSNFLYEFSESRSKSDMPDFLIIIEEEGLYVCNNKHAQPWSDIEFIEHYLLGNNIPYRIHEL